MALLHPFGPENRHRLPAFARFLGWFPARHWTSCATLLLLQLAGMLAVFVARPEQMIADDNQLGLPVLVEMGRQVCRGELPLLSTYSWEGAGIAGEYGSAFFHPPVLGFAVAAAWLPLSPPWLSFMWIEWCHAVLLTGTWCVARLRGLSRQQAFFAGCCLAAGGYLFGIAPAWWVVLQSVAWLPWYWWALERACRSRGWKDGLSASVLAGFMLGLLVTAGWNFTDLMALVVHCVVVANHVVRQRTVWPVVAGTIAGMLGVALSAPSWMMLLEYSTWAWRMVSPEAVTAADSFRLWPRDWLAAIYPFAGHHSGELQGQLLSLGTIPPLVAIAGVCCRPMVIRRHADLVVLVAMAAMLCSLPDVPPFRWMFRFIPLLSLSIAMLAATVGCALVEGLRRREPASLAALAACAGACLIATLAAAPVGRPGVDARTGTLLWAALVAVAGGMLLRSRGAATTDVARRDRVMLPLLGMLSLAIALTTRLCGGLPWGMPFESPKAWQDRGPATQDTWYLANYGLDQIVRTPQLRSFMPGNPGGLSGIRMLNGYSTMQPYGPLAHFRIVGTGFVLEPARLCHGSRDGRGLLRRMAVDGLILRDDIHVEDPVLDDFARVGTLADFGVWHRRSGTSPLVQSQRQATIVPGLGEASAAVPAAAPDECVVEIRDVPPTARRAFATPRSLTPVAESAARVVVEVDTTGCQTDALVSFARPWLPGYRASLDGAPLPVRRMDLLMPAVIVPPDRCGRLELQYWPASLAQGLSWCAVGVAAAVLVLILTAAPWMALRRRTRGG